MKKILIISLTALFIQVKAQILNVESFRIKTDTTGLAGKMGLNFALTKNTQSLISIGTNIHIQYKTKRSLYLLYGNYNLLSSESQKLVDNSVFHIRYNYKINKIWRWEFFVQGQKNSVSKIEFRGLVGTGIRIKLSKNDKFRYYFGSTSMYEHETQSGGQIVELWRWSNYFSMSLFPTKTFSFISTTYYQPAFSHFSDYRIASQNSLISKITDKLAFKTGFNLNYDAQPVIGIPKLQYNLISGILYSFGK